MQGGIVCLGYDACGPTVRRQCQLLSGNTAYANCVR